MPRMVILRGLPTLALALVLLTASAGAAQTARADPPAADPGLVSGLVSGLLAPSHSISSAPSPSPAAAPCADAPLPGDHALTVTSGGLGRTAVLHLPPAPAGRALPLILAFHGYGGEGARFAADSGLSALADQDGFAVVYPSSLGKQWAISGRERDVVFASDLIETVESLACVDRRRIYGAGVSVGAGMAARIGCELSARIAALVLVSGGYRSLPRCEQDRPVSLLEIHGTSDSSVPYHGQGPGADGAVLPYVAGWAARDRCNRTPTKRLAAAHVVLYRWSGCASGAIVEHLRIYGSGHGLPNAVGPEISSGNRSRISGVRNIWHFLAARTLGRPFAS